MIWKLVLAAITVLVQQDMVSAEFTMIPSTTTAAELWNPYTWFWPYAIASAESYRDYFSKAQKATNELYQQIYATNANPLITGNWGGVNAAKKPEVNGSQNNSTQNNQGGNTGNNNQGTNYDETNQQENGGKTPNEDDSSNDETQTPTNSTNEA